MAWTETTYTAHAEVVLDQTRVCTHCGRSFMARLRAFGKACGVATSGLFGSGHNSAQQAATQGARTNAEGYADAIRKKLVPHRCTHCGKFGNADLDVMRASYADYRSSQWGRLVVFLIAAPFAIALLWFVTGAVISLTRPPAEYLSGEVPIWAKMFWGSSLIVLATVWIVGWRILRPIPEAAFQAEVDAANQPETIGGWLNSWNSQSELAAQLTTSLDVNERLTAWLLMRAILIAQAPAHVPTSLWPEVCSEPPPPPPGLTFAEMVAAETQKITAAAANVQQVPCPFCAQSKPEIPDTCPHCRFTEWNKVLKPLVVCALLAATFAVIAQWWFESRIWVVISWIGAGFFALGVPVFGSMIIDNWKAIRRRTGLKS